MPKISVCINVDTRPVRSQFEGLRKGACSRDFLDAGIANKRKFFEGHDCEFIVTVDEHEGLTTQQLDRLHALSDCLIVRKHTKHYRSADPFGGFNDVNFLQTLFMARGDVVCHFDGDMAAFCNNPDVILCLLQHLDQYKFVCYPSTCSPAPCYAPEYQNQFWASTRFFMCKRETLKFDDLERAIRDPQWFYNSYSRPPRENPWLEQFLGIMGEYKVLYPPVELSRWAVFPWMHYQDGVMERLNAMPYDQVRQFLEAAGGPGIFYDGADSNLMRLS